MRIKGDRIKLAHFSQEARPRCCCFAEDGINEAADRLAGAVHCLIDRSVVRNVENEELTKPDAQNIPDLGVEFALSESSDPVIEKASVS